MSVTINNPLVIMKQQAEASGKKFTTGTMVLAAETGNPVVTHNLGSVPSIFFMIAKNVQGEFTFNAENRPPQGIYGYFVNKYFTQSSVYFNGNNITDWSWKGNSLEWRNNNTTPLDWYNNSIAQTTLTTPTDTQIELTYRTSGFVYLANQEYEWLAIE